MRAWRQCFGSWPNLLHGSKFVVPRKCSACSFHGVSFRHTIMTYGDSLSTNSGELHRVGERVIESAGHSGLYDLTKPVAFRVTGFFCALSHLLRYPFNFGDYVAKKSPKKGRSRFRKTKPVPDAWRHFAEKLGRIVAKEIHQRSKRWCNFSSVNYF